MKKRILSAFLCIAAVIVCFVCLQTPVSAATSQTNDGYTYSINNGRVAIYQYYGTDTEIEIPAYIEGYPVALIGSEAFENNTTIQSVVIPEGVTYIGDCAFAGCENLKNVLLPSTLTWIGEDAFYGCNNLQYTEYDHGQYLGNTANSYFALINTTCNSITCDNHEIHRQTIVMADRVFANHQSLTSITIPGNVYAISHAAFIKCYRLIDVTIENGVKEIGHNAFNECGQLETINIPESVTSIGSYAFSKCCNLTTVTVNSGNTHILYGSFSCCEKLEYNEYENALYLGNDSNPYILLVETNSDTIESCSIHPETEGINSLAFNNCSALTSIEIPGDVISIGDEAFYGCSSLTSITLSDKITHIGSYAFKDCASLTEVIIPDNVVSIGDYIFCGCSNLEKITLSDKITYIGNSAFRKCTSLTEIVIPDNVTSIGDYAFFYCTSLTEIVIPDDVIKIGDMAFCGCSNLKNITLSESLSSIGSSAFKGCTSLTEIILPDNVSSIGYSAFDGCTNLTGISIPDGVTSIGNGVFYNCSSLTNIVIPDSVTSIGEIAFYNCSSLTEITIPEGLISIGSSAFDGCTNMTAVHISNVKTWCEINFGSSQSNPLYNAKNLYYNDSLVTNLVIPEGTESISQYAFYNCVNLASVTIPDGVNRIGTYAFYDCVNLKNIRIPSSVIQVGSNAFGNCSNIIHNTFENGEYLGNESNQYHILCETVSDDIETITIHPSSVAIAPMAFNACSKIKSIIIPETIKSVGYAAFSGCSSLESITIPFVGGGNSDPENYKSLFFGYIFGSSSYEGGQETIQENNSGLYNGVSVVYYIPTSLKSITITGDQISNGAFRNCSSLNEVTFLPQMSNVEAYAFEGCSGLTRVNITDIKAWCEINFGGFYSNPLRYAKNLYVDGVLITELKIPDTATRIGEYAFCNCSSITSVSIPESVVNIEYGAFSGCSGLTKITIPNNVTNIEGSVFSGCSSLTNITIPDSVTSIGYGAFSGCSNLTEITIPNKVTNIGSSAFRNCSSLTSIIIPDSVTSIGSSAFSGCSSLESMTIPFVGGSRKTASDTYQYPFGYIFGTSSYDGGGEAYQSYYGSKTGTTLSHTSSTYYIPTSLKSVTVTGGEILFGAFEGCSNLTNITIPDNITSIGDCAFRNCSRLTSIAIPDSVTRIGGNAFQYCTNLQYNIYDNAKYLGNTNNPYILLVENADTTICSCEINSQTKFISIRAFENCRELQSIIIPDGVISIGNYAFWNCSSLTKITIPDSVTSIGAYAFYGCSSLESMTIPFVGDCRKTASDTYQYPFGYFFGTSSNTGGTQTIQYYYDASTSSTTRTTYYIPSSLKSVTVTGGEILYGAFYNCSNLTTVTIGEDVTNINKNAFYGCTGLKELTIGGEPADIGGEYPVKLKKSGNSTALTIENYAFSTCTSLDTVTFIGDAPVFGGSNIFSKAVTVYYPANNSTWTADVMQDYGGEITWVSYCPGHNYESVVTPPTTTAQGYTTHTCTVCGDSYVDSYTDPVKPATPSVNLRFASAYLSLESDLSVIFQVKSQVLAEYDDVTLTFKVGQDGQEQVFSEEEYFIGQYSRPSFKITGVAPRQVTETIYATLHGYYDGVEYSYTMEYSASKYCYSTLRNSAASAKLKTLIVDLLNYASAHQVYGSTNLENMANASLTDAEKALGTATVPTMTSYQSVKYVTHAAPTARFKNASLYLEGAVTIRCLLNLNAGIDINNVTVKITDDAGNTWTVLGTDLQDEGNNNYYLNFKGLSAQQMRKVVYLTICENGKAISHTLRYSIETYAASKYSAAATNLKNLLLTMIRYGDAAKAYLESK